MENLEVQHGVDGRGQVQCTSKSLGPSKGHCQVLRLQTNGLNLTAAKQLLWSEQTEAHYHTSWSYCVDMCQPNITKATALSTKQTTGMKRNRGIEETSQRWESIWFIFQEWNYLRKYFMYWIDQSGMKKRDQISYQRWTKLSFLCIFYYNPKYVCDLLWLLTSLTSLHLFI
jgi:hypothetical protein